MNIAMANLMAGCVRSTALVRAGIEPTMPAFAPMAAVAKQATRMEPLPPLLDDVAMEARKRLLNAIELRTGIRPPARF
jgi:hypothetical protein